MKTKKMSLIFNFYHNFLCRIFARAIFFNGEIRQTPQYKNLGEDNFRPRCDSFSSSILYFFEKKRRKNMPLMQWEAEINIQYSARRLNSTFWAVILVFYSWFLTLYSSDIEPYDKNDFFCT